MFQGKTVYSSLWKLAKEDNNMSRWSNQCPLYVILSTFRSKKNKSLEKQSKRNYTRGDA